MTLAPLSEPWSVCRNQLYSLRLANVVIQSKRRLCARNLLFLNFMTTPSLNIHSVARPPHDPPKSRNGPRESGPLELKCLPLVGVPAFQPFRFRSQPTTRVVND